MSQRTNIKQPILKWFDTDENHKLPVEKGYKKFIKDTKLEVRQQAFNDYHKHYASGMRPKAIVVDRPGQRPEPEISLDDINIKIYNTDVALKKKPLPKGIFEPYKTGTPVDIILSKPGGVMKGTTFILDGPAGVGKSTVGYAIQYKLRKNYPKAKMICVNSEMTKLDLQFERQEKEWMKNVDFFLLGDPENIPNMEEGRDAYDYTRLLLMKIFSSGYDFILVDSFEDIIEKLKEYCNMTRGEAEAFLLGSFKNANEGENNMGVYTAIISINQVTKGGVFVGSNKLRHNTTGMMHLNKDNRGERYAEFEKNRRGGTTVDKKMYYSLNEKNEVIWDEAEFKAMQERSKILHNEKERLKAGAENFNKLFQRKDDDETIGGKVKKGNMSVSADGEMDDINDE